MPARFLPLKLQSLSFPWLIHLRREPLKRGTSCFSSDFCPLILAAFDTYHLQPLFLGCLPHGTFLFPSSVLRHCHSTVWKSNPFSLIYLSSYRFVSVWAPLGGSDGKESVSSADSWFDTWVGKIPWRRTRQPTPVFLPGEFCGQRSLAGYHP